MNPVEQYQPSDNSIPVIGSLPHSGIWAPKHVKKKFTDHHLNTWRNTDWHLDKLYDFMPELGVHLIKANFSRYVIDPNRALTTPLLGPYQKSPVYENNTWGETIYLERPSPEDISQRVEQYYLPYHQQLSQLISDLLEQFPKVYLLDLHSFMGPVTNEVCLGNRNGETCVNDTIDKAGQAFTHHGFDVVNNRVFRGGEIVRRYGADPRVEALQIELRYTTYLEEAGLDEGCIPQYDTAEFKKARKRLQAVFIELFDQLLK